MIRSSRAPRTVSAPCPASTRRGNFPSIQPQSKRIRSRASGGVRFASPCLRQQVARGKFSAPRAENCPVRARRARKSSCSPARKPLRTKNRNGHWANSSSRLTDAPQHRAKKFFCQCRLQIFRLHPADATGASLRRAISAPGVQAIRTNFELWIFKFLNFDQQRGDLDGIHCFSHAGFPAEFPDFKLETAVANVKRTAMDLTSCRRHRGGRR